MSRQGPKERWGLLAALARGRQPPGAHGGGPTRRRSARSRSYGCLDGCGHFLCREEGARRFDLVNQLDHSGVVGVGAPSLPQGDDLAIEVVDLRLRTPPDALGRSSQARVSPSDWDSSLSRRDAAGREAQHRPKRGRGHPRERDELDAGRRDRRRSLAHHQDRKAPHAGCRLTSWMLSPVTAGSALFSLMMSFVQCAPAMLFVRWVGTALLRIAATVLVRSSMAPKELQAPACLGRIGDAAGLEKRRPEQHDTAEDVFHAEYVRNQLVTWTPFCMVTIGTPTTKGCTLQQWPLRPGSSR